MILLLSVLVVLLLMPHNIVQFLILKYSKAAEIPKGVKPIYDDHINSSVWRNIRKKRLEKDRYTCQYCSVWRVLLSFIIKPKLQVHHKTYKRFGAERITDLVTLCVKHHNYIHKRKRNVKQHKS